jgi:ATP-binding cassette subfamily B protein
VGFAYNSDNIVLKNISFNVEPGKTIAIVGSTGSGKTSIINVLCRFYEYQSGQILLDGVDIRNYEIDFLRNKIAVVLQDVFLYSDTILNNITLGDPSISKEEVIAAAKLVGAHDFIAQLPNQYDFDVKERGGMLSTGQRQLIAFIRSYVYRPEILILDEATSSVDTESEELIQQAIKKLTQGRTSIVIAHRLSTIRNADQIVVMDKGEIIEMGSHEELLKLNKRYSQLYKIQFALEED